MEDFLEIANYEFKLKIQNSNIKDVIQWIKKKAKRQLIRMKLVSFCSLWL